MRMVLQGKPRSFRVGFGVVIVIAISAIVAVVYITGWGLLHNEDLEMVLYLFGLPLITGVSSVGLLWMYTSVHVHAVHIRSFWRSGLGASIGYACLERTVAYTLLSPGYIRFSSMQYVAVLQWTLLVCLQWLITLVVILGVTWTFIRSR